MVRRIMFRRDIRRRDDTRTRRLRDPTLCSIVKTNSHEMCARENVVAVMRPGWRALFLSLSLFAARANGGVVINEVMYHPPKDLEDLQYIELFNAGSNEVDLSGWKFNKGVKFTFAQGTKVTPGGFLVVCRNRSKFVNQYGPSVALAGEFEGHLSHNGEQIELSDSGKVVVDAVRYSDSAPWPLAPDGRSSSLERICPDASGNEVTNWDSSKLPDVVKPGGTPGRTNDSYASNLPPVILSLIHI